ncbi:MAG: 23S rRNA-intervening sequence protein [Verrucomicrobia bacterium]|nr:MAG: 23S rRNA-intervening sequence protein [Verrucomicrobiota bacterium]
MSADKIESWRELVVWQKAHAAVLEVYRVTKSFPPDERFRLTNQLCRAAASIPTNIAEGKGRGSRPEFRQFLIIARGSIEETRYLLLLAKDLGFLAPEIHAALESIYTEISKMTNALLRSLKP